MRKTALVFCSAFVMLFIGCMTISPPKPVVYDPIYPKDKRCAGCDDISDLFKCSVCWGHHKASEAHLDPPLVRAECPICFKIHKFTEPHIEPIPMVCSVGCPICGGPLGPFADMPHHCPHCPKLKIPPQGVAFEMIGSGNMCNIKAESHYVINNQDAWVHLFNEYQTRRCGNDNGEAFIPPAVDFTKERVVAVFMGECGSAGNSVNITSVVEDGVKIVVNVESLRANTQHPQLAVMTYPFYVVKFRPGDLKKTIKINETTKEQK